MRFDMAETSDNSITFTVEEAEAAVAACHQVGRGAYGHAELPNGRAVPLWIHEALRRRGALDAKMMPVWRLRADVIDHVSEIEASWTPERRGMPVAALDWGEYWIPSELPANRSAPALSEWWRANLEGFTHFIQSDLRAHVIEGAGCGDPFNIICYHGEADFLHIDAPLVPALRDVLDAHRSRDGLVHPESRSVIRAQLSALRDEISSMIAECQDGPEE
jgi:hypothetical protein